LELIVRRLGTRWISSGHRGGNDIVPRFTSAAAWIANAGAVFAGLLSMVLWSFAKSWRFPDALPSELTLANWERHFSTLQRPLRNTMTVGISAMVVALLLALGVLEHEARSGRRTFVSAGGVLYFPLLVPQVAFLFGTQILLVLAQLDGRWIALTWMHLVFVFPYVFLSLSDPYRAWDDRYARTGLCLGATPARVFLWIKLPMLLRPITTAAAVGFAVSVGLYLPTLFAGSGRYATLTTEAVTLSASGDNRLIGLYALLQMTLPLMGFILAAAVPGWFFRHHQGMQVTR
jgi:putative thiamine transport system permease protein